MMEQRAALNAIDVTECTQNDPRNNENNNNLPEHVMTDHAQMTAVKSIMQNKHTQRQIIENEK